MKGVVALVFVFFGVFFFFNDTATTEIYTLSLHDALPICTRKLFACRLGPKVPGLFLSEVKSTLCIGYETLVRTNFI